MRKLFFQKLPPPPLIAYFITITASPYHHSFFLPSQILPTIRFSYCLCCHIPLYYHHSFSLLSQFLLTITASPYHHSFSRPSQLLPTITDSPCHHNFSLLSQFLPFSLPFNYNLGRFNSAFALFLKSMVYTLQMYTDGISPEALGNLVNVCIVISMTAVQLNKYPSYQHRNLGLFKGIFPLAMKTNSAANTGRQI